MARDLHGTFGLVKQRFAEANDLLGFDLARFCFEGPEEDLRQTRVTQPALFVHSVIVGELLAELGVLPTCAAGHSLGEYSALCCAKAFDFATGLELVKVRANAMQAAGEERPGTMAAVVGLEFEQVEKICSQTPGIVVPANYNSPGQLVISGEIEAVDLAMQSCKTAGAKLVRKLVVSGAFHSPLMASAAERLRKALDSATINSASVPVMSNATGKPHGNAEEIRLALAQQLLAPVRWTECLNGLSELKPEGWMELGPGNVLAGLLKRTISGASAQTVGTVEDIERVKVGVAS
ncbi:MAG: ACP S-malonyltransferase [Calditrichaeota bacterium]|nr:ACP S-malonyltransferase [Calditrichota bacterium]MCB9366487.1 ACP S-malonyltransferase [Calditrichota bacterium]MCB9391255.1 ACP S-malonyltransferase [Calditrichota bacterium]